MSHNTDFKTLQLDLKDGKLIVFYRANMQGQAGITGYAWFYMAGICIYRAFRISHLNDKFYGSSTVLKYRRRAA